MLRPERTREAVYRVAAWLKETCAHNPDPTIRAFGGEAGQFLCGALLANLERLLEDRRQNPETLARLLTEERGGTRVLAKLCSEDAADAVCSIYDVAELVARLVVELREETPVGARGTQTATCELHGPHDRGRGCPWCRLREAYGADDVLIELDVVHARCEGCGARYVANDDHTCATGPSDP